MDTSGWRLIALHSAVPGRVRYRLPNGRNAGWMRRPIEMQIGAIDGVRRVAFNPVTASLLVVTAPAGVRDRDRRIAAALTSAVGRPVRVSVEHRDQSARGSRSPGFARRRRARRHAASATAAAGWHTRSIVQVERALRASTHAGLTDEEARRRLEQEGANTVPPIPGPSALAMVLRQLDSFPTALLAASAAFSLLTGGRADAAAIAGVIGLNTTIGYLTERSTEKVIRSLAVGTPRTSEVIRAGRIRSIPTDEIVRGDLLVLRPGTYVAADARLVSATRLLVDESTLTGESEAIGKRAEARIGAYAALADRANMVFRSTVVVAGEGRALVVATGLRSELGQIQVSAATLETPQTPIQQQLDRVGRQLVIASGIACGVVFLVGLLRGLPFGTLLRTAVSLAVAAVPEGLPAVATSTLALGVLRMREQKVAIRRLEAIEALGAMRILCLDKTGTLTENRMTVTGVFAGGRLVCDTTRAARRTGPRTLATAAGADLLRLLETLALCNDSRVEILEGRPVLVGSATENALVALASELGVDAEALRARLPRLDTQYRSDDRRYMVTTHRLSPERRLLAVKGSPEEVIGRCRTHLRRGEEVALDGAARSAVLRVNDAWAGRAMRVLAVASATVRNGADPPPLTLLGLVGMSDPVRAGVPAVIERMHRAGVGTVMITGDQARTAVAVAEQLRLAGARPLRLLEASELAQGGEALLSTHAHGTDVFARVSPAHKLRVIQALQRSGHVVAMTGDGVNDGPALRAANIGIAMGRGQQDLARTLADIVLEDDDLATLLAAVAEGRTVFSNIRKAIRYLLGTNFSEIETMLVSLALGLPAPLNPMQLLWINLLTDVLPAVALGLEPEEPDVLRQPPRDPREPILSRADLPRLLRESALITAGTMLSYCWALARHGPGPRASTQAFGTLTTAELLHAFSSRSSRLGLFDASTRPRNRYLDAAVGASLALQALALMLPPLRRLLGTTRPGFADAAVLTGCAVLPYLGNEWLKHVGLGSGEPATEYSHS